MDKDQSCENKKSMEAQQAAADKHASSGEEFAEKMYDDEAPTPKTFDEEHEVSSTGSDIQK